jgi:hypothetical protein
MSDQTQDRVPYSYDEIFPERFLHAPDLDGRTVTLLITDIWGEYIQNPKQKRKKERGDLCGVLAFERTKREYAMSKQNAWIIKALWGKDPANIRGKRITIAPVPDSSGFTEHGTRILFVGSPDIDNDVAFTLPGGQALTFKKTVSNRQEVVEGAVDPVTGEVGAAAVERPDNRFHGTDDDLGAGSATVAAETPATPTQTAQGGDAGLFAAPTTPATETGADDGDVPGRGPLVKTTDPVTPERKRLFDVAWDKAINEGADEAELLAAVCDAVGAPTLEGLTMEQAAAGLQYLKAHS